MAALLAYMAARKRNNKVRKQQTMDSVLEALKDEEEIEEDKLNKLQMARDEEEERVKKALSQREVRAKETRGPNLTFSQRIARRGPGSSRAVAARPRGDVTLMLRHLRHEGGWRQARHLGAKRNHTPVAGRSTLVCLCQPAGEQAPVRQTKV